VLSLLTKSASESTKGLRKYAYSLSHSHTQGNILIRPGVIVIVIITFFTVIVMVNLILKVIVIVIVDKVIVIHYYFAITFC